MANPCPVFVEMHSIILEQSYQLEDKKTVIYELYEMTVFRFFPLYST
jgi:hypothetical protein